MTTNQNGDRLVYIVAAKRTPIGSIGGSLASLEAHELATCAIKACIDQVQLDPSSVEKVWLGQVIQGGGGQSAARQAQINAGIPPTCRNAMIMEVCASGLQAIIECTISINSKYGNNCLIAAGVESMSTAPRYLPRAQPIYSHIVVEDSIIKDGLTDPFNNCLMGHLAEKTGKSLNITRKDQDNYARESFVRAANATKAGILAREICPVEVQRAPNKPAETVSEDENYKKFDEQKMRAQRPCFDKVNGTITSANASSLGDGAAACILMSAEAVAKHGVAPLARVVSYGDDACDPKDFSISPVQAVKVALERANLTKDQISLWEINEAFSVVALANIKLLELDPSKVNINGGGVSIGHPLGMSGVRIINTLIYNLKPGEFGCAGICRGGGGAAAMIIQKL